MLHLFLVLFGIMLAFIAIILVIDFIAEARRDFKANEYRWIEVALEVAMWLFVFGIFYAVMKM